ncbi:HAD family hydrolase [Bremerella cremea]|uniref:HAD family hydrolase n=1 Tax=Bremerella cremea TaxID=1031537 RepID=A0A368KXG2_9BACT|nr:HAD hydrolase-like protein [Bremerella cremea]RCS55992.1 HAD family hydrolase [Bremerella cremea]
MVYQIEPKAEFLVGIDSDGCVFDTMELKHKECFIPNIINYYELQGVSKYAREAAEFVNLYSKSRGINRFPALVEALEWLQKRPEVQERGAKINIPESLLKWIKEETKLGNPALEAKVAESNDPDLAHCLKWSKAVNETVAGMVRGVPPFPSVRKCLEKLSGKADMLVVSATPNEALEAEWSEHDIAQYVTAICGQEAGNKKETLTNATKYKPNQTLMIGDAPGDYKAAVANDCLFYPINPGDEENSWKRFHEEGIDKFLKLEFAGDYQKMLLEEFDRYLPEKPSWPVID